MAYGENYVPDPWSNVPPTACPNIFWAYGSGAPTCTGFPNQGYIDTASGDIYQYQNGAWALISSGGGGGGSSDPEIFRIAGSGTPSTAPVSGAGYAYNDVGNTWNYQVTGWAQQT